MAKLAKTVGLAAALGGSALALLVASQPTEFQIERSIHIDAPSKVVFAYVNDFGRWSQWSPFYKAEPTQKVTMGQVTAGEGATYAWEGKQTGQGHMEIVESRPDSAVKIKLEFEAPMKASNLAHFAVSPEGKGVTLSWAMTGERNFVQKAFGLLMDMDKMVGGEFNKGLTDIKLLSEVEAHRAETAINYDGQ